MFLKPCYRTKNGKRHAYWALVESYRTSRGPRHRVVAYLGQVDPPRRCGVKRAAGQTDVPSLFDPDDAEYAEVDVKRVRVERCLDFGGPWLGWQILQKLDLPDFLDEIMPTGREQVPWPMMAAVLVLCQPSSDLHIAEHLYKHTAIADLLGVPVGKINDDRLYRALDRILEHKDALQIFLKNRLGSLFDLEYDLLLYDVTSTYFEGLANGNPKAQRGYSRDKRGDCKQVCIGLVVTKEGLPLGYEVFAGNRSDVTTVEEIVETMEDRYGRADRIWAMDRGMVSEDNMEFLREEGRRYIVGTPKGMLRQFERELLAEDWASIRDGLEVKLCPSPEGDETFILCRSADRREKEKAMHERFARRIEEGLRKIEASCAKRKYKGGDDREAPGPSSGPQQPRGGVVRDGRGHGQGRPGAADMAEGEGLASVGRTERGLLPASDERDGLVGRGPVAGVHPIDGRGSGVPDPQVGHAYPSDLAPEGRAGGWAHSGVLPGVHSVEDAGSDVQASRAGRRASPRTGGVEPNQARGRGASDA